MQPLYSIERIMRLRLFFVHALIWALGICGIGYASLQLSKRIGQIRRSEQELKKALARVKHLSGLIPICASCKKIRDDRGYWTQIEAYVRDRSDADFSHSICPECEVELYPEYTAAENVQERDVDD